jgi:hypothetical protein
MGFASPCPALPRRANTPSDLMISCGLAAINRLRNPFRAACQQGSVPFWSLSASDAPKGLCLREFVAPQCDVLPVILGLIPGNPVGCKWLHVVLSGRDALEPRARKALEHVARFVACCDRSALGLN